MHPYLPCNLRNYFWMAKWQLGVKQIPSIIPNVTTNKNELWKIVSSTSFQIPQLQSVSIYFKFDHQFLLLYLLCYVSITVKPVYCGQPVYYGHRITSQNFQLPYIFCKVDQYIVVTLYITVTLPLPKVTVVHRFYCIFSFTQFGGFSHGLSFDKFRNTTPPKQS